mmetsp:Transcript_5471/g.14064  ORF Transcript_5471/g.14064 Transcript_5471/m.14064 type:complete len:216 (+) Transcript_5471:1321-1968(+)
MRHAWRISLTAGDCNHRAVLVRFSMQPSKISRSSSTPQVRQVHRRPRQLSLRPLCQRSSPRTRVPSRRRLKRPLRLSRLLRLARNALMTPIARPASSVTSGAVAVAEPSFSATPRVHACQNSAALSRPVLIHQAHHRATSHLHGEVATKLLSRSLHAGLDIGPGAAARLALDPPRLFFCVLLYAVKLKYSPRQILETARTGKRPTIFGRSGARGL